MIRNLTNVTWGLEQIAREKGTLRCVKSMRAETTALLEAIVKSLTVKA